jgi:type IV pilus assembly protein PilF
MKALCVAVLAALLLSGCVTTESFGNKPPDLKEAARLNTQLGVDYMRKGDLDAALEKLQKALKQDPDLAMAHSAIAVVYTRKGDNDSAEEHYKEALSLNSEDPFTLNNFGVFLCGQGKIEKADKYFMKAIKTKDYATPEAAWANAGLCARRIPDLDKAEADFREALRLNPQFAEALSQMAWLCYHKKDYLRARAFLQRYEAVGKPTPETLWIGAMNERQLGDSKSARAYERRLKIEFPDADETYQLMKQTGGRQ